MKLLEKMLGDSPDKGYENKETSMESTYEKRLKKNRRRKIILISASTVIVAGTLAYCIGTGIKIRHENFVEKAKSIIAQEEIKSAFKDPEFPENGDWDKDGIKNGKEKRQGTNLQSRDSDKDGLTDGDEEKLGTDPKKEDTDDDGLPDGCEVMSGLDPRKTKSDGKTEDKNRIVTVKKQQGEAVLTLTGDGKIADTSIEELDLYSFNSNTGIVSKAYDAYCPNSFKTASITFSIDENRIKNLGINKNDLSVFSFNSSTKKFTKISSSLDSSGKKITAKISRLGTYVVGTEKTVNKAAKTKIFFLIDNSGSMYPKEKCIDSTENDVDFKRIDFAESLVDKFDDKYETAVAKFTGTYTKLCGFTTDKDTVKNALESIKQTGEFFNGTHSQTAILNCINEFSNYTGEKYKNVIVMLTDGESDETNARTLQQIEAQAKSRNIVVLTVGLGGEVDRKWLHQLASETGGRYYSASEAGALEDVYNEILTSMNYDMVNYKHDDDDITGYSLYNTGFRPEINGLSFKNFRTTTTSGVDYGMAVLARDWYMGNLKKSLSDLKPKDDSEQKVNAAGYDISNTKIIKEYETHTPLNWLSSEMLSGKYSDVKQYLDYDSNGKTLKLKDELREDAASKGWIIQNVKLEAKNLEWKNIEMLSLDVANSQDKITKANGKDDGTLAALIYRLNALRWDDEKDEYSLAEGETGFKRLEQSLAIGEPVVTTIDDMRTVNSISLIQEAKCHRNYVLQVYDNSYPDQTKEIYIEKKPVCVLDEKGKLTGSDYVYTATYEGKQVGIAFSQVTTH